MRPATISCGGCGAMFAPREPIPSECPHCGERLTAPRRQLREAELEARARQTFINDPRRAHRGADPRRSRPL